MVEHPEIIERLAKLRQRVEKLEKSVFMRPTKKGLLMGLATEDEFLMLLLEDPAGYIQERFSAHWIDEENGVQAIFGLKTGKSTPSAFALLFMRDKGWTRNRALDWLGDHPEYLPWRIREALAKYRGKS